MTCGVYPPRWSCLSCQTDFDGVYDGSACPKCGKVVVSIHPTYVGTGYPSWMVQPAPVPALPLIRLYREGVHPPSCKSCRFWGRKPEQRPDHVRVDECIRRAPIIMPTLIMPGTYLGISATLPVWPKTDETDRCGEYALRSATDDWP